MDAKIAAVIVHDIKNALGILEGELQQLTVNTDREQAMQAHATCVSLRDKLIGFLTLYKASSQGLLARIESLSPEDFLNALVKQHVGSRANVHIVVETNDMPVLGFFDEHLVGLALEAALQNATRFARSTIWVGCRASANGGLLFTVRDDGDGLGAKDATPSTGLGIELCRAIADAHRNGDRSGSVVLDNAPEGGAIFTLYLP